MAAADDRSPRVLQSLRGVDLVTVTRRQQVFAGAALNVLVNVVVLNLFVEFADEVVIDSFWISVLTAVLLTTMIGILARFEQRIHHYFFEKHSWRFAGVVTIWLVLFGGKFVMLEVVNIVFGDHVSLGHLLEVILIVVAMMIAGQLMQVIYDSLGVNEDPTESPPEWRRRESVLDLTVTRPMTGLAGGATRPLLDGLTPPQESDEPDSSDTSVRGRP